MILSEIYIESVTTYWVLRLALLALLMFCGYGISYHNSGNRYFWHYAVPVIIFYALSEGLRFERGDDYNQYMTELRGDWYQEGFREPLYDMFILFVRYVGIPYWAVFVFYSALLITSFMSVIKKMPMYAVWAFPLFFLVTDYPAESMIRQFVAIPFIFFAFSAYLSGRKVLMFVMLAIVPFIHFSGLLAVGVFLILVYVNLAKFVKSPWILVVIYLLLYTFFDVGLFDRFSDLLQENVDMSSDSERMLGYVENSDRWFTNEGSISYIHNHSVDNSIATVLGKLLFNLTVIFFGFKACKSDSRLLIPYWFSYVAIIIFTIGGDIELYDRFGWWLYYLVPLVVAGIMTYLPKESYLWWAAFAVVLLRYVYPLTYMIGNPGHAGCAFVWDIIS